MEWDGILGAVWPRENGIWLKRPPFECLSVLHLFLFIRPGYGGSLEEGI